MFIYRALPSIFTSLCCAHDPRLFGRADMYYSSSRCLRCFSAAAPFCCLPLIMYVVLQSLSDTNIRRKLLADNLLDGGWLRMAASAYSAACPAEK